MIRIPSRVVLVSLLALVAGVTALAQRGGGGFGGSSGYFPTSFNNVKYDGKFTFIRMSYLTNSGGRQGPPWSHDYPTGEDHFMRILTAVTAVAGHTDQSNVLAFGDPEFFKFPVAYLVEPGYWSMADGDVAALRSYLLKGGFLIVDDFPDWAWPNFDLQMSRVFPQGRWIDLDATHPIFHSFFEIDRLDLVSAYPNLGGTPIFRGMFEDNDPTKRMYVIANFRQDLSEFWETSEKGLYIVQESNEAYKYGVNEFIYGITH